MSEKDCINLIYLVYTIVPIYPPRVYKIMYIVIILGV